MEHIWKIEHLETSNLGDLLNVVTVAHWRVNCFDAGSYVGTSYGSVALSTPEDDFIDFENLSEEIVLGWVKDALGALSVETAESAAAQTVPELPKLPWA